GAYTGRAGPGGPGMLRVVHRVLCPPGATAAGRWVAAAGLEADPAVADAREQLGELIGTTITAAALLDAPFTISELRAVYEAVWGRELDPSNFRRAVRADPASWVAVGGRRAPGTGRPAALYRAGAHRLAAPLPRPR